LTEILLQRRDLDKRSLRLLERELKKHPWSQPLRMMYARALKKLDKPGFEEAVNKAAAVAPDPAAFRDILSDRKPVHEPKPQRDLAAQLAIIDRFLENEPRISAPRADIPEGELAPESLDEPEDMISETLADVLVKQGKTVRAIDIFEKLSLKFPEKSSYFAKKIESVLEENNKTE